MAKKTPRPRLTKDSKRNYPEYYPGMTTEEYVVKYFGANPYFHWNVYSIGDKQVVA